MPNPREILNALLEATPSFDKGGLIDCFPVDQNYRITLSLVKAGSVVPNHQHDEDNFNYALSGAFEVNIEGQNKLYLPGDWFFIGAGKNHSAVASGAVRLLEFWRKTLKPQNA